MGAWVQFCRMVRWWEQVEALEHHADFAADGVQRAEVAGELRAVDEDAAFLVGFEAVDAADHGALAGAGRAADDDAFLVADGEADVPQDVHGAVPLIDLVEHDGGLVGEFLGRAVEGCGLTHGGLLYRRTPRLSSRSRPRL